MTIYKLHIRAEMLRDRMHQLATKYGRNDKRVLQASQELDVVMVEIMRGVSNHGSKKAIRQSGCI